jgi:hypothetical protein
MILTYTNKRKDEFTEMYKHLDKYYITENTQNYSNGEIILHKPENTRCELRHALQLIAFRVKQQNIIYT